MHAVVWFDPVSVHITWIELLRAKTPVDEDVLNASRQNAATATRNPFRSQRRRGVNPNRLPISSNVAR